MVRGLTSLLYSTLIMERVQPIFNFYVKKNNFNFMYGKRTNFTTLHYFITFMTRDFQGEFPSFYIHGMFLVVGDQLLQRPEGIVVVL